MTGRLSDSRAEFLKKYCDALLTLPGRNRHGEGDRHAGPAAAIAGGEIQRYADLREQGPRDLQAKAAARRRIEVWRKAWPIVRGRESTLLPMVSMRTELLSFAYLVPGALGNLTSAPTTSNESPSLS